MRMKKKKVFFFCFYLSWTFYEICDEKEGKLQLKAALKEQCVDLGQTFWSKKKKDLHWLHLKKKKSPNKLNMQTLFFSWLTLNDNAISFHYVYVFICFTQCFISEQLVFSVMEINIYFWGCIISSLIFWFWYWISSAELHTAALKPFSNEKKDW